jgi:phage terminase large subunit GpA-like protein
VNQPAPNTAPTNWRHYCYRKLAAASRPRDRLTVSMWADRHRWLSSKQSGEPGPWRTSRNPMLREIMDCFSEHSPVTDLSVMKSSQVGITEAVVNALGYTIEHDPCPAMVLMPTLESRDSWKAQKLNPLFTETEVVREVLGGNRSRDAANRQDMIDFPAASCFWPAAIHPTATRRSRCAA